MRKDVFTWVFVTFALLGINTRGQAAAERFRQPAPAEDADSNVMEPMFGAAAGLFGTDETLTPMEWVAKRTWYTLGLPYNKKDFTGPPAMKATMRDGWVEAEGTVVDGGVPCRNQVITAEVEQFDKPLLVLVRSADAFGDVLMQIDLVKGEAWARSITIQRSMIGGQSHSSPDPEFASAHLVHEGKFDPVKAVPVTMKIRTQGSKIQVWAGDREICAFTDPDPAGGKFGLGSVGRMRVRNVQQWELISKREQKRRQACIKEMHEFCKKIDGYYEGDVKKANVVKGSKVDITWTFPKTGATAVFLPERQGPRIKVTVRSGLYGNEVLLDGACPDVSAVSTDGEEYVADPSENTSAKCDDLSIETTVPLKSTSGKKARAYVTTKLSVQTVWFWTVRIEGMQPKCIRGMFDIAPALTLGTALPKGEVDPAWGLTTTKANHVLRHDAKCGFYFKALESANTVVGARDGRFAIATSNAQLRFATVIMPAQPLNMIGFKNRMVHYIRYPEGPVQQMRRAPSFQEYPDHTDLHRFANNGTTAMVWHHTWIGSDFRDREGFIFNNAEMDRAMKETHQLGMKMIGYLGIVPGRSSLLRFEDLAPNGNPRYGRYEKNWDLQDATFYHMTGRYPEFLVWMTDYWCKTYGLNGFYLDGGSFGSIVWGPTRKPLYPDEDAGMSLDEIANRTYYRVCKVLELNKAGYGLEPWSGLDWMRNGFYDCMMIGESFQEAKPEYYRDGYNALLTGCTIKMYGMRETSQNAYNVAMAGVNLSDIQVCSGDGAWGDDLDNAETWKRVRPLWDVYKSIDWDRIVDARPWYAQELVSGEGFYAGNYTLPDRAIVFLANKTEQPGKFNVRIDPAKLGSKAKSWKMRYCLGGTGDIGPLGDDGRLSIELPPLHGGPIGIELLPAEKN